MIRKLLTFFPFFCIYTGIAAQQNMTLYQMHDITQSNFLNPAVASDCKWNIGFPALGNISIAAGIPISYSDIAVKQQHNNIDFPEQSDTYLP
jgi:hypothetical protein